MRPSWSLSPSYYNYSGCQCMGGYSASYTTKCVVRTDVLELCVPQCESLVSVSLCFFLEV